MTFLSAKTMPEISRNNLIKMSIIFTVFTIFLAGATGLLEITISQQPLLSINNKLFNSSGNYNLVLKAYCNLGNLAG